MPRVDLGGSAPTIDDDGEMGMSYNPNEEEPTGTYSKGGIESATTTEPAPDNSPTGKRGPVFGVVWWFITLVVIAAVAGAEDLAAVWLILGWRSVIALIGYLIMQVGLWHAEFKWDEEGSQAYLEAANIQDATLAPEDLEKMASSMGDVTIPDDKLKAAFPIPWGFLIGWWVWGLSYLFPLDGTYDVDPTPYGIVALVVCLYISMVASVPMSKAVMARNGPMKMKLSLGFLIGWILLGIFSALDVVNQANDNGAEVPSVALIWILCLLGPITVIISQKLLFAARKMGTFWEEKGTPNFSPIVYNMGGPLFVWAWFIFWIGICGWQVKSYSVDVSTALGSVTVDLDSIDVDIYENNLDGDKWVIPLFVNWRTLLAFFAGCGMVPVVRFLDYAHDLDGFWMGENNEGKVFGKWWLGTDGTYFGLFLESPWPFVIMWVLFGFASFLSFDNEVDPDWQSYLILLNCLLQGVDAGILIQANLYAGNLEGKTRFSMPFVLLFILLALNIGSQWSWHALILSLPGAILIILGQKTVFGARRRGDFTMKEGKPNPYKTVFVYTWGEVFFMMGWISICWAQSMPPNP